MMRFDLALPAELLGMFMCAAAMNRRKDATQNSRSRYTQITSGEKKPCVVAMMIRNDS